VYKVAHITSRVATAAAEAAEADVAAITVVITESAGEPSPSTAEFASREAEELQRGGSDCSAAEAPLSAASCTPCMPSASPHSEQQRSPSSLLGGEGNDVHTLLPAGDATRAAQSSSVCSSAGSFSPPSAQAVSPRGVLVSVLHRLSAPSSPARSAPSSPPITAIVSTAGAQQQPVHTRNPSFSILQVLKEVNHSRSPSVCELQGGNIPPLKRTDEEEERKEADTQPEEEDSRPSNALRTMAAAGGH
jgi:hypothetical protein